MVKRWNFFPKFLGIAGPGYPVAGGLGVKVNGPFKVHGQGVQDVVLNIIPNHDAVLGVQSSLIQDIVEKSGIGFTVAEVSGSESFLADGSETQEVNLQVLNFTNSIGNNPKGVQVSSLLQKLRDTGDIVSILFPQVHFELL